MRFIFLLILPLLSFAGERERVDIEFKDYCICKNRQTVSYGDCTNFCSSKDTNGSEILYSKFLFRRTKHFRTLQDWCMKPLPEDDTNPGCFFTFLDGEGKTIRAGDVIIKKNTAELRTDSLLASDTLYILNLSSNISSKTSDRVQIIKFDH